MSGGEHHPKHCGVCGKRLDEVVHKRRKSEMKYLEDL
jgi:hypothetical protein